MLLLRSLVATVVVLALSPICAAGLAAQASPVDAGFVGDPLERYLRDLELVGLIPAGPWSIRTSDGVLRSGTLAADTVRHPWAARPIAGVESGFWSVSAGMVPITARSIYNSSFPFGSEDGSTWAGRGFTGAVRAGAWARLGPLSVVLAPEAFWAANRPFDLRDNGRPDNPFADPRNPTRIDLPQRFGETPHHAIAWGQSSVRLDAGPVAAGVSAANQIWGPAQFYPFLLGTSGPGFPHLFVGTSRPLPLFFLGEFEARLIGGRLERSEFAIRDPDEPPRFAPGVVGVFRPSIPGGLEIGMARFYHVQWPEDGLTLAEFLRPLESPFANIQRDFSGPTNQIASAFARWAFPRSGLEVYGEIARNDHSGGWRDLALQPDHDFGYSLGFSKGWARGGVLDVVRAEVVDASISHLVLVRHQVPFYRHSQRREGHTHRGQLLGSPAIYGGIGNAVSVERYHGSGWAAIRARREVYDAVRRTSTRPAEHDTHYGLELHALHFFPGLDLGGEAGVVYNRNRGFERDRWNLRLSLYASVPLGVRRRPGDRITPE